ncbi:MAG TPA: hypothetical protein VE173_00370 [Longimicrobiales bacterium]|nr:hypothetical protein [Longimicrobiales bacterium]
MSDVVYRAHIRIERERGPRRKAHLPAGVTVTFGVHGAVAEHYGVEGREEDPTTLDHVMAATGG